MQMTKTHSNQLKQKAKLLAQTQGRMAEWTCTLRDSPGPSTSVLDSVPDYLFLLSHCQRILSTRWAIPQLSAPSWNFQWDKNISSREDLWLALHKTHDHPLAQMLLPGWWNTMTCMMRPSLAAPQTLVTNSNVEFFSPHPQAHNSDTSYVSYHSAQFWHYEPGHSIAFHRLRAQSYETFSASDARLLPVLLTDTINQRFPQPPLWVSLIF